MEKNEDDISTKCLRLLLLPVMRFCLRRSLKLQEIIEVCKVSLVEAAEEEIEALGERKTVNRLSVMTGLHRSDVARLQSEVENRSPRLSGNIINRVVSRWQVDKRFLTSAGRPRILAFDGKDGEFAQLLRSVSSDPNPYTVLFELERIGAVETTPRGIKLCSREYIVSGDVGAGFQHLSQDSDDLIAAVEENIFRRRKEPNLHLRTEYDNVGSESLPEIRAWLLKKGSVFHAQVRDFLSHFDRDINKKLRDKSPATRVSICSFGRAASKPRMKKNKSESTDSEE